MSKHLTVGTKIKTPYGEAKITRRPGADGVAQIQYKDGDREGLNTRTEKFQVTEPK